MKNLITRSATPIGALIVAALLMIAVAIVVMANITHAGNGEASQDGRLVTIHDRGIEKVIMTQAETVGDALTEAGIILDPKDTVEPSANQKLVASDYQVNIYRARPVIVVDGAIKQKIVTPYQTAPQIVKDVGIKLYPEDNTKLERVDDIIAEGAGLRLTIDRATPFKFTLYGETITARTQAKTVGDMLKEKDIKLTANDRVSVDKSTPITSDLSVRVWREGKQTVTVDESVDFPIDKISDANREVGYREIRTPGEKGSRSVTYEIEIQDGKEVSRTEIASITTKQPKTQVELVGAKNNYSSNLSEWLAALRSCEARANGYTTNTGNGFYGAYQFMISTWDRIAPKVDRPDLVGLRPDLASPADQDMMIVANTKLSTGGLATQNPGCYQKLGLSQFPPS